MTTVAELKEILEDLHDDDEILHEVYDANRGITSYTEANIDIKSISRDSLHSPMECKEGDGGNEYALVVA